jgi:hypothetical protein
MFITITAVLVFKVIDFTFLTSILVKAVDQKGTEPAASRDQVFHNKNVHEKKISYSL